MTTMSTGPRATDGGGLALPNLAITEGAAGSMGVATLVGGTVTVNTTAIRANSRVFLTRQNEGGTVGDPAVTTKTAGTSFVIKSSNAADTSQVAWLIINPAT